MNLPKLLRRLQIVARAEDLNATQDTLALLAANDGWTPRVMETIAQMDFRAAQFIDGIMNPISVALPMPMGITQQGGALAAMTSPMSTVARDSSGVYCPANSSQWATVMSVSGIGSGGPVSAWLCQESSGNLADSIASATLTVTGSPTYGAAVAGWSRKAITFADAGTVNFSGTEVSWATNSGILLMYWYVSSNPVALRTVGGFGTASGTFAKINTTGTILCADGANTASGSSTFTGGTVRPLALVYNRALSTTKLYSDQDKVQPTYGALANTNIGLGAIVGSTTPTGGVLYAAAFDSTAAELTDAQIKTILQTLGWSPAWS